MTVIEKIKKAIVRHPDWDDQHVARTVRNANGPLVKAVREGRELETVIPETPPVKAPVKFTPKITFLTLDKIRQRYDTVAAIQKELLAVPRGKLISEADLCQVTCGKDRNRFRKTVENNQDLFRPLRVKIAPDADSEPRWVWGCGEDIQEVIKLKD